MCAKGRGPSPRQLHVANGGQHISPTPCPEPGTAHRHSTPLKHAGAATTARMQAQQPRSSTQAQRRPRAAPWRPGRPPSTRSVQRLRGYSCGTPSRPPTTRPSWIRRSRTGSSSASRAARTPSPALGNRTPVTCRYPHLPSPDIRLSAQPLSLYLSLSLLLPCSLSLPPAAALSISLPASLPGSMCLPTLAPFSARVILCSP